jgi:hypothetical protein
MLAVAPPEQKANVAVNLSQDQSDVAVLTKYAWDWASAQSSMVPGDGGAAALAIYEYCQITG